MDKRKLSILLLIVGTVLALIFGGIFVFKKQKAALLVETQPGSMVLINGEEVGRTPYEGEFSAGEVVVKLIPSSDKPLIPFETKITLTGGVKTIVRRTFGESEGESTSAIVSFEKGEDKKNNIAVVSTPDAAGIYLDGQFKDISPVKMTGITAGVHELTVKADGYKEQKFSVQAISGYNLTAVVTLAKDFQAPPTSPSPETIEEPSTEPKEVKILDTPTGFLRVRDEAASSGTEVGRVTPGKTYKIIEHDTEKGWYKIVYEEGKEGWVSDDYATPSASVSQ